MLDFLAAPPFSGAAANPLEVLARLIIALVLGGVVAWIYRATRVGADYTASFPPTLVLLAILIAMVTQVIGDSVARAFSLVGALSIVRFRTVVRDTQDTAFVIFAVVVGMATGAADPRVALIGIGVVGLAAFIMKRKPGGSTTAVSDQFTLKVRILTGLDLNRTVGPELDARTSERRLVGVATAKQGSLIDAAYCIRLRPGMAPDELVQALNRLDGVQSVDLATFEPVSNLF
jgi:Domain of unknown function (DUF4956)